MVEAAEDAAPYPFFTCGDEILKIRDYAFDTEAVLLAGNGNFGIKYYRGKFNAYQRTYVIEPKHIRGKWLYYLVLYHIQQITKNSRGSTIKYLRLGDIANCQVLLPSILYQDSIVDKIETLFSDLDKGEEHLRHVQRQLKRYRQSVLKAAVTGELTRDWREANRDRLESGEALLQRILKTRREQWQGRGKYKEPTAPDTTDLPSLPEGWAWVSLGQLSSFITSGSRGWAEYYSDDGAYFFRSQNVTERGLDVDDIAFVTPPSNSEGERTKLQEGDLLVSITGSRSRRRRRDHGECADN